MAKSITKCRINDEQKHCTEKKKKKGNILQFASLTSIVPKR